MGGPVYFDISDPRYAPRSPQAELQALARAKAAQQARAVAQARAEAIATSPCRRGTALPPLAEATPERRVGFETPDVRHKGDSPTGRRPGPAEFQGARRVSPVAGASPFLSPAGGLAAEPVGSQAGHRSQLLAPAPGRARPRHCAEPAPAAGKARAQKPKLVRMIPFMLIGIAAAASVVLPDMPCEDRAVGDSCAAWAQAGECAANPAFMLGQCRHSCGACGADAQAPSKLHRRASLVAEYELGPLYLALALLGAACTGTAADDRDCEGKGRPPPAELLLHAVQMVAAGFVLPWTAVACSAVLALGGGRGPLALAFGGTATGLCLFLGALAVAMDAGLL